MHIDKHNYKYIIAVSVFNGFLHDTASEQVDRIDGQWIELTDRVDRIDGQSARRQVNTTVRITEKPS